MSTIAGYIDWRGLKRPADACRSIASALSPYGAQETSVAESDCAALARNLRALLPEDRFDAQPIRLADGRRLLVADIRVDNRDEIIRDLGWTTERAAESADSALMAAAWEAWEEGALQRVIGDFAVAIWSSADRALLLARSPMALKPLFFHHSERFCAFASMPAGVHALDELPKTIDLEQAAAIGAQYGYQGGATFFADVCRVEHGHVVRLTRNGRQARRYWEPQRTILRLSRVEDYVDQFREELNRAVEPRLRRPSGRVASQLSAGRDSSAVTATAARLLARTGNELIALTGAPRIGFAGPALEDRVTDESELARLTAARHRNIRHVVRRPTGESALTDMRALHALAECPMLNPTSVPWWEGMNRAAVEQDASVMLFGSAGNFTISAGGADQLRDILIEDGFGPWLLASAEVGRWSWAGWRNLLSVSFGPALAAPTYRSILRATGRSASMDLRVPTLRPPYRQAAEDILRQAYGDPRPPRSFSEYRKDVLLKRDNAEIVTLARWGLDSRDPTGDRRLVEFCLSLPNELLVSGEAARPLFERAMADRIPRAVLANRRRGYQGADWYEHFKPADVRRAFADYARNALVQEMIDIPYVNGLIDQWPRSGFGNRAVINLYRNSVLATLALADFLDVHFPN